MTRSRSKTVATCKCGKVLTINSETYRANLKRNGVYTCQHCASIAAGAAGKYSHSFEVRSKQSNQMWADPEFRKKVTDSNIVANNTETYRASQSIRTTKLWEDEAYRTAVTESVTEALQDPIIREKISAGVKRCWEKHDYRMAILSNLDRHKISSLQTTLYAILDALNIPYHPEGPSTTLGYYAFDCMIPNTQADRRNILIECQGNYWHSLPKSIRNDKAKFTYITKYFPNHEIMYIWEHEFHTKDRVMDRLKLKLGLSIDTVDFDFCDTRVVSIPYSVANNFLINFHYLQKGRGGKAFGVFLGEELIACAVFSPPIRQNTNSYFGTDVTELSRLCIHPSYHKKNFGTWLLSRVLKQLSGPIIAYADTTVGHTGGVYRAANFKLHHTVPSDYWYVDDEGFVMHKLTLYRRAVSLHITEAIYAATYGYRKQYGGEKLCFTYRL